MPYDQYYNDYYGDYDELNYGFNSHRIPSRVSPPRPSSGSGLTHTTKTTVTTNAASGANSRLTRLTDAAGNVAEQITNSATQPPTRPPHTLVTLLQRRQR